MALTDTAANDQERDGPRAQGISSAPNVREPAWPSWFIVRADSREGDLRTS